MSEEKTVTISKEAFYKIDSAINSINELASTTYARDFGRTFEGALSSTTKKEVDQHTKAFIWMLDHYNDVQAAVLAIRTISEFAQEYIPVEY